MSPLIQLLLDSAISLIEKALEAEGPSVIAYLESELAKLKSGYGVAAPAPLS